MHLVDIAERILSETSEAILYADQDGVIRLWNGGCERMFGFAAREAVGRPLDIIIPTNLRARHRQGYSNTVRTGVTRYAAGALLSVPAIRKDGARISIEFSITPFRSAEGKIVGMAAIIRDVSERFAEIKRLKRQLVDSTTPD
ncbi:hypothetical protein AUC70_04385 [Methyloceanibacter stevinii]|uniref:PAS sensor protein n=1 Tax=Methyloceanibacter stevinii TaxID=1774970 RepID=A0A1E3VN93_9HYPH|nr:hypothetical protein AUC70_04385 [Methyloceanibacter stevinii]